MKKPPLKIDQGKKLPQFDMPVDFLVYDDITANILRYYTAFPCKIDACVLCYVERGSLKASVNLWDFEVKAHDFAIVLAGRFFQIHEVSDDLKVGFCGFSSSFLKRINYWKLMSGIIPEVVKKPFFTLPTEMGEIYANMFSMLTSASIMPKIFMSEGIAKSIMGMIVESLGNALKEGVIASERHSSRELQVAGEFMQLAYSNYREEHKITFYANEANLTLSHFCNVINNATGMTPQEIIKNLIIMDAKSQLKGTSDSVAKIAGSLGFGTATTFNRYLKTYTGMTPLEYRAS